MSIVFVGWVAATAALAVVAIGAPPQRARRLFLVALLPVALGAGGWLMLALMTGPKPHYLEWRSGQTELVAQSWVEGEAIYLWVRWPGEAAPRAYRLPWSEETARQIEEAAAETAEEGGEIAVAFQGPDGPETGETASLEFSLEQRELPMIYALPQPRPPDKPVVDQRPSIRFSYPRRDESS